MKRIIRFYFRRRKTCLLITGLLVAFVVFYIPEIAFAADDPETAQLIDSINKIVILVLQSLSAWIWPVILMIGSLLDNDLVFGGVMGDRLLSIWVQIRNLVNIIFVLVLLAIAVYNVLGLGEEGGGPLPLAFKTAMPKFVLALIAVNFSFLAIKVVLDFTNVMTGAVFAIPANVGANVNIQDEVKIQICGKKGDDVPMKPLWCKGEELSDRAKSFFSRMDKNNITVAYAIRYGRLPNLKYIKGGIEDIGQLAFNILFNTVIFAVYALSFVALFLVLLFRVVALWIAVVLSPLIALSIVLPNLKDLAGEGGELKTKFVQSAIAPITIGLVLTVGFIMLDGFSVDKNIHGEILSSSSLTAVDPNALPTDLADLQQLMIAVGVVVIVWTGVFSAADKTVAGSVTKIIREKAEGFGKFAAKLPMYAPVIPTKTGERVSAKSIFRTLEGIPGAIDSKYGKSLLPGGELRDTFGRATSKEDVGKAFKVKPQQLKTEEGFAALKRAIVDQKIMPEAEMKRVFTESKYEGLQTAEKIWQVAQRDQDFGRGLKAAFPGIKSAAELHTKIEAKEERETKPPVKTAADAVSVLSESGITARRLIAEQPAAFRGASEQDVGTLIGLLGQIRDAQQKQNAIVINSTTGVVDVARSIAAARSVAPPAAPAAAPAAVSAGGAGAGAGSVPAGPAAGVP